MAAQGPLKNRAFLSYAHADGKWGTWLHRSLESFRLDSELVGRDTPLGPVPKSLVPIFRDRDDFSGGHSLPEATIAALDSSASLIVLCSTVAASRPMVNEEVRLFRSRHPERPVVPAIIEGTYPSNYPPALRYELFDDGSLTDRQIHILGPDLRDSADGRAIGLAKIVAGITGLATDDIVRRAARAQRRRTRFWISGLSAGTAILSGLTVWAELNRRDAVAQRAISEERRIEAEGNFAAAKKTVDGLTFDIAAGLRGVRGVQLATIHKVLDRVQSAVDQLALSSPNNMDLARTRGAMFNEFSGTYIDAGDQQAAVQSATNAVSIARELLTRDPQGYDSHRDLEASLSALSKAKNLEGNKDEAIAAAEESVVIARWIAERFSDRKQAQSDLATRLGNLGYQMLWFGQVRESLVPYRESLELHRSIATQEPANVELQRNLMGQLYNFASVAAWGDDKAGQLKGYDEGLAIARKLLAQSPDDASIRSSILMGLVGVEEAKQQLGDRVGAVQALREMLSLARDHVMDDPQDAWAQRYLQTALYRIGNAKLEEGDRKGAVESFDESISVARKWAIASSNNGYAQRNLAQVLILEADMKAQIGDTRGALEWTEEAVSSHR